MSFLCNDSRHAQPCENIYMLVLTATIEVSSNTYIRLNHNKTKDVLKQHQDSKSEHLDTYAASQGFQTTSVSTSSTKGITF